MTAPNKTDDKNDQNLNRKYGTSGSVGAGPVGTGAKACGQQAYQPTSAPRLAAGQNTSLIGEVGRTLEWVVPGTTVRELKEFIHSKHGISAFEMNCRPELSLDDKVRGWEVAIYWHGIAPDSSRISGMTTTKRPSAHAQRKYEEK